MQTEQLPKSVQEEIDTYTQLQAEKQAREFYKDYPVAGALSQMMAAVKQTLSPQAKEILKLTQF